MARPMSKSLYDWCIENNYKDYLELWDYELNNCNPKDVGYKSNKKYWFKCPKNLHSSELKKICVLTNGKAPLKCNRCNSFGQWCLNNNKKEELNLWDYELNDYNPFEVAFGTAKKCYFKCPRGIHESEKKNINHITNMNVIINCNQCNSFGQYLVDMYEEDTIERYWDYEKNTVNPFEISRSSNKKVWIKCQEKDYHPSYEISCYNFYQGNRCPYCASQKIHPKDSFAQYHIDNTDQNFLEKYWSKKNTIDPFGIAPNYSGKIWIICQNDKEHEDYKITGNNFTKGRRCGKCRESYGERIIAKWLDNKNIRYIREKTFPYLLGIGNDFLRYDFYLLDYNLLIEYQGEQHEQAYDFFGGEEKLKQQQEHDRRKKEYAELHNIKLLEIWYTDFNHIEEILNKNIK